MFNGFTSCSKFRKNDLNQFDKHTGNISLDALSANEIQSFLYKISKINKLSISSTNRKLAALKSFFKYLRNQEIISTNYSKLIQSLKLPKRIPNYLSEN